MKVKELLKSEICYFCFETDLIPAKAAGLNFNNKFGYARVLNPYHYMGHDPNYFICGVYDYFTNDIVHDIGDIANHDFIMNQKSMFPPILRGEYKWKFIDCEPMTKLKMPDDLPHMISSHFNHKDGDVTTYYKNGIYAPAVGMGEWKHQAEYKFLKHLEETDFVSSLSIITNLYAELLKQTRVQFKDEELLEKFILIAPTEWENASEHSRKNMFRLFKRRFSQPLFRDIPARYREKAINEVDRIPSFNYALSITTDESNSTCNIQFNLPDYYFDTARIEIRKVEKFETVIYNENINKNLSVLTIDIRDWQEGYYLFHLLIDGFVKDGTSYTKR